MWVITTDLGWWNILQHYLMKTVTPLGNSTPSRFSSNEVCSSSFSSHFHYHQDSLVNHWVNIPPDIPQDYAVLNFVPVLGHSSFKLKAILCVGTNNLQSSLCSSGFPSRGLLVLTQGWCLHQQPTFKTINSGIDWACVCFVWSWPSCSCKNSTWLG
jgi:hypothetical protein